MKMKAAIALTALLALAFAGCGEMSAPEKEQPPVPVVTAEPDPNPPVAARKPVTEAVAVTPAPAATPTPTPTPIPTPEPTPSLRPGEYVGSDGSVLNVGSDGSCTYETELSGTVNGQRMKGRVTFHGTVEDGVFTFTKITYFGLDLTAIAKAAGYGDADYWETAAAIIYAGG